MILLILYAFGVGAMWKAVPMIEKKLEMDRYGEPAPFWMRLSVSLAWPAMVLGLCALVIGHWIVEGRE